jgi:hypothetical protein
MSFRFWAWLAKVGVPMLGGRVILGFIVWPWNPFWHVSGSAAMGSIIFLWAIGGFMGILMCLARLPLCSAAGTASADARGPYLECVACGVVRGVGPLGSGSSGNPRPETPSNL